MTTEELKELFNKHSDKEFIQWERVPNKRSRCPDIHAFLLLEELCPYKSGHPDMVCAAEHDEIYLRVEPEELAVVATEELVIELLRCGVRYDDCSLCMFV